MDEILIGEKKYISSKRAAKATGYAKDYIGQLCREGRVPARLVGRSWYVLESAIHDHRFGIQGVESENIVKVAPPASTWESPRYEASSAEILPSVSRIRPDADAGDSQSEAPQGLQDSWKAWFDRVADSTVEPPVDLATLVVPEEQEKEEEKEEEIEVPEEVVEEEDTVIPIHTIYELPPEDLLPRHHVSVEPPSRAEEEEEMHTIQRKKGGRRAVRTIQVIGTVLAIVLAASAVLGSGYFDKYIISNSQVSILAGVASYNR